MNHILSTMASRLRYYVRMSPPVFIGSKVEDHTQYFLDKVYKVVNSMR